ncbi:MAG: LysR family transcriptional regulator [Enterobacteriaceae bacterium]|jgi:DNA-binding transcriptional LysR family regulator|nr:LysR family transcriptional regulator [Enterobacteriaceae bacterium]
MEVTLRQIRYFVATAEIGQISLAAQHLNISQSAVTNAIQTLECCLNHPLFVRSAAGVTLTETGHYFLNHAYEVLRSLDDALNIPQTSSQTKGQINLVASYTVMGYFLPFHLQRLSQIYPNLRLKLYEAERREIETGLLAHHYDMAVVLTDNLTNPGIFSETLFRSERRLWLPARHPLLECLTLNLADLADEPFIMLAVDEAELSASRYWGEAGLSPNIMLQTSSIEAVRSMVANGMGISILSDLVYRPWSLEGKRIETRSLHQQAHPMSVGLAWCENIPFTPAMQAFRDYFHSVFLMPQQTVHRRPVRG